MPVIRISEPTFRRLQAIAVPLVDTPSTVVDKVLDVYDSVKAGRHPHEPEPVVSTSTVPPDLAAPSHSGAEPDLTHARIISGAFAGTSVTTWNNLVHAAHRAAFAQLGTLDQVKSISRSNILRGRYRTRGFHYLKDLDVSIQNVNANDAWRRALHMARRLNVPIHIEVEWEDRRDAAHPGQRRTLDCPLKARGQAE